MIFYSSQGTKVNRSLAFLFKQIERNISYTEHDSSFTLKIEQIDFQTLFNHARNKLNSIDKILESYIIENPDFIGFAKWGYLLPLKHKNSIKK